MTDSDPGGGSGPSSGYESARPDVQELVPLGASRVLDLGCSSGRLGEALKTRQAVTVVGVEPDGAYASQAVERLDRVVRSSAEAFLDAIPDDLGAFDCLVAADVLEHLVDPWAVLARTVPLLDPGATVVISLPNVLYWPQFSRLFTEKRWPRDDTGVFDRTHLRWFTRQDAVDLAEGAGLRIERVVPSYWSDGYRLAAAKALSRTGLGPFTAAQYLVVATVPTAAV